MNQLNMDRIFSNTLLMISGIILIYGLVFSNIFELLVHWDLRSIIDYTITYYFDFMIIGYIFICLQFAGYFELKYQQDYLTCSIMSILLTPLSLLLLEKND